MLTLGKVRNYNPYEIVNITNLFLILIMWGLAVYYSITQVMARTLFTVMIFTILISIYVLDEISGAVKERVYHDIYLLINCGTIIVITGVYLTINYDTLSFDRTGIALHHEYMLAFLFTLAMFYLIQRSFGWLFLGVIFTGGLYAYLGPYVPGVFGHGGMSFTRILNTFVLDFNGFYGSISGIVAAWVTIFMLYAGLLQGYGAFTYIMRLAYRATEYVKSGVAQSAVAASLIIGSINGGQTTNAAMTGSMTIPLMKESGLRPASAAAIEAVASSGGQIMPPVMGAAAFIMASLLGITYWNVVMFGIIPALIFYACVMLAVHYKALDQLTQADLRESGNQVDSEMETISKPVYYLRSVKFIIPFLILVYTLGYIQYTVPTSALLTSIAMVITGVTFPYLETFFGQDRPSVRSIIEETVDGLKYGALMYAPIVVIAMAINGIVDIFNTTGVPGMLALALMDLSGGILIIALLLAMFICIVLGLGMPTVASYTLVAMLVAPGLIQNFGLAEITVHYFVLYAAILSGLTPPIAIAVVITVSIANANFWQASYEALKISAPLYVLPFTFIYSPEVFISESITVRIFSSIVLLAGALVLTHALNYHNSISNRRIINYGSRLLIAIAGVATMVAPALSIRLTTLAVGLILVGFQVMYIRNAHEQLRSIRAD